MAADRNCAQVGRIVVCPCADLPGAYGDTDRSTGLVRLTVKAPGYILAHEALHVAFAQGSLIELPGEEAAIRAFCMAGMQQASRFPILNLLHRPFYKR